MTPIELKQYIYENNKIKEILSKIGCGNILYHENKEYYSCSNAIGGDCNNPAAINIKNNPYLNYINYTRGVSVEDHKDLINLVQYNMSFDFPKALKFIHKLLGLKFSYTKPSTEVEVKKETPVSFFERFHVKTCKCNVLDFHPLDENIIGDFLPCIHIDLFREGIIKSTIKKFGLGYSYRWKRTIFPVRYWSTGELMGYNARTSVENYEEFGIKKYYITPGMRKDINLYGLYENYEEIQKAGLVTVFEAEKSVLKRDSRMDYTAVALQGHSMSDEQVRILLGLGIREIVIALDKDVPDEEVWHMCEKFYRHLKVSYIKDRWNLLGDKDSPADACSKKYKFLFNHRIVYDEEKHKKYLRSLKK